MRGDPVEWRLLTATRTPFEAEMLLPLLKSAGIQYAIRQPGVAHAMSVIGGPFAVAPVHIYVPVGQLADAREIVQGDPDPEAE